MLPLLPLPTRPISEPDTRPRPWPALLPFPIEWPSLPPRPASEPDEIPQLNERLPLPAWPATEAATQIRPRACMVGMGGWGEDAHLMSSRLTQSDTI